ncbi:metallophosphoesterase [Vitiosangium sp. GDMCC 1.1324]|uniref:metallophosphoesterase n=1 Tax=Vitiosangium sp. (strain GDMCC 1.1324) TaxID=2138576 RepID=UPI000D3AFC0A|nr:hypothetical protein DAT35_29190 [Vitiosangium sp. GDMCC 1.1324]
MCAPWGCTASPPARRTASRHPSATLLHPSAPALSLNTAPIPPIRSTAPWKVAFFHHPPWSSGEHGSQLAVRREFGPLFERYGVDLVLTGHDHNYERSKPMRGSEVASAPTQGVSYLVVGSGGAALRAFPESQPTWAAYRNNTAYGYLDVVVENGALRARFLNPGGVVLDSLTLSKTVTAAGGRPVDEVGAPAVLRTPPGPVDDPAVRPAGLGERHELAPVDDSDVAPLP